MPLPRTPPRVAVLGTLANEATDMLVRAWRGAGVDCTLVEPRQLRLQREDYDVVLGRLDVLPTLDGVEPGLLELLWAERAGLRVLNGVGALLATHDKLRTATLLARAGLPQPHTRHLAPRDLGEPPPPPVVVKPRFGSWGRDVRLCETRREVRLCLEEFAERPWFRRHGAIVQDPVPTSGHDLRVVISDGKVIGSAERVAAPGEWRTNISVGGIRRPADPPELARSLALRGAQAIGADLVGVDLFPLPAGGFTILELNGAVEFDDEYSLAGGNALVDAASALRLVDGASRSQRAPVAAARPV